MNSCGKVKNPCKICLQQVTNKNGLQCMGACRKWVHFKCLNYTPGKIADIKAGVIKVTCPCPNCNTSMPKEYLTNPPYSCTNQQCPANKLPLCTSKDCPVKSSHQMMPLLYANTPSCPKVDEPPPNSWRPPCPPSLPQFNYPQPNSPSCLTSPPPHYRPPPACPPPQPYPAPPYCPPPQSCPPPQPCLPPQPYSASQYCPPPQPCPPAVHCPPLLCPPPPNCPPPAQQTAPCPPASRQPAPKCPSIQNGEQPTEKRQQHQKGLSPKNLASPENPKIIRKCSSPVCPGNCPPTATQQSPINRKLPRNCPPPDNRQNSSPRRSVKYQHPRMSQECSAYNTSTPTKSPSCSFLSLNNGDPPQYINKTSSSDSQITVSEDPMMSTLEDMCNTMTKLTMQMKDFMANIVNMRN